jgi:hypothetical protein
MIDLKDIREKAKDAMVEAEDKAEAEAIIRAIIREELENLLGDRRQ